MQIFLTKELCLLNQKGLYPVSLTPKEIIQQENDGNLQDK
jgi:hypothetical protein